MQRADHLTRSGPAPSLQIRATGRWSATHLLRPAHCAHGPGTIADSPESGDPLSAESLAPRHLHRAPARRLARTFATARQFTRAIVMPNLVPPVTTVAAGAAHRDRILAAVSPTSTSRCPRRPVALTRPIQRKWHAATPAGVFTACKLTGERDTNSASPTSPTSPRSWNVCRHGIPPLIYG